MKTVSVYVIWCTTMKSGRPYSWTCARQWKEVKFLLSTVKVYIMSKTTIYYVYVCLCLLVSRQSRYNDGLETPLAFL